MNRLERIVGRSAIGISQHTSSRTVLYWFFPVAFLLRLVHSWRIPMPSNDGAQYLWMSERFAHGDFSAGLNSIFPPGSSLLHALFMQAGMDSFTAARVDGALLGALWVLLLHRICLRFADPLWAFAIATMALLSFDGIRLVAEVYSEPLYMAWVSAALLLILRRRLRWAAFLLGSAYWIRPEALALLPLLFWPGWRWPERFQAIIIYLCAASSLIVLRLLLLPDTALTPKLELMLPLGPLGASSLGGFLSLFAANLVELPLQGLFSLHGLGLLLGLMGLILIGRSERSPWRPLLASLTLGWLAMCLFQVKPRFFLSQAPLLLPLAAYTFHRLRQLAKKQAMARDVLRICLLLFALSLLVNTARVLGDILDPPRSDRLSELALGQFLSTRLQAGDRLVCDLPRVAWAAGRQPPPPTIWTPERIEEAIRKIHPRFVILGRKRPTFTALRESLSTTFRELPLPPKVQASTGADRLALFEHHN